MIITGYHKTMHERGEYKCFISPVTCNVYEADRVKVHESPDGTNCFFYAYDRDSELNVGNLVPCVDMAEVKEKLRDMIIDKIDYVREMGLESASENINELIEIAITLEIGLPAGYMVKYYMEKIEEFKEERHSHNNEIIGIDKVIEMYERKLQAIKQEE